MIKTKLTAGISAAAVAAGVLLSVAAASPASAAEGCGTSASISGARTATQSVYNYRYVQLRGNQGTTCAWGRITNSSPGDKVHVDRGANNTDLSNYPYNGAGQATVSGGNTQAFTPEAYNDNGTTMRACLEIGNRPELGNQCTTPY